MARRILVATLALCACAEPAKPLGPPPSVEMIGCVERRPDRVCEIVPGESKVTFWIDSAETPALALDGAPIVVGRTSAVQAGWRFEITAREGALHVTLAGREPYRLRFVAHEPGPDLSGVTQLRRAGDFDAAEARLDAIARTATVAGALGERARNAMARGDNERARRMLEASIRAHERAGRLTSLATDLGALTHLLVERGFARRDARAALARLEALARDDAWAAIRFRYHATTLAVQSRDPRAGIQHVREAIAQNLRLGRTVDVVDLRQYRIILLRLMGRWKELRAELDLLSAHLADDLPACQRAQVLNNVGWNRLLGTQQVPELFGRGPVDELREGAALYRTQCPIPQKRLNAELGAGWAALFERDEAGVRHHLDAARAAVERPDVVDRLNIDHLTAAWIGQSGDHARAVDAFGRLAARAREVQALDIEWQAHLGRGRAEEGRDRLSAAADAYEAAQAALRQWALRVPLGEGRDTLMFTREASARALVSTLSRLGRGDAAIRAIREAIRGNAAWARQQNLWRGGAPTESVERLQVAIRAARAELDDAMNRKWLLPADSLPRHEREIAQKAHAARRALDELLRASEPAVLPPLRVASDEALVFAHPGVSGLHAWVVTASKTTHIATASTASGLDAIGAPLARAKRVGVYAHPGLVPLAWDALSVEGKPLFRHATLVFHADLGAPGPPPSAPPSAMIIADPAGELPRARAEASRLATRLEALGYAITRPAGEVTVTSVSTMLREEPTLLHYSGHGIQEGLDGLDAGFPLGGGRRFTVVDALSLGSAPRRVVLAACDLGARETAAFSMAQAFLLEGAEAVVAAVRPVDDEETSRWVDAFYRYASEGDWAEALRATRVELASAATPTYASAFRLWVRD